MGLEDVAAEELLAAEVTLEGPDQIRKELGHEWIDNKFSLWRTLFDQNILSSI